MYYIMGSDAGDLDPARIGTYPRIPTRGLLDSVIWISGKRFNRTIPTPLQFEIDPDYGREMPDLFTPNIPLFRDRLIKALRDVGVDNLDLYEAVIRDPRGNKEYTDYKAVNIIGMVAAADMNKSKFDETQPERMLAVPFDGIVIDEGAAGGLLMFRLGQSASKIVVHEKIKEALEPRAFPMVDFRPTGE